MNDDGNNNEMKYICSHSSHHDYDDERARTGVGVLIITVITAPLITTWLYMHIASCCCAWVTVLWKSRKYV